jgi:sulfur carrier protein
MNIILNNTHETIDGDRITVSDLLGIKNFTFKMLIVKINGKLISKGSYNEATIGDGDDVQVLHLISGG